MLTHELQPVFQQYLASLYKASVRIVSIQELGAKEARDQKSFGYGKPYRITFELGREIQSIVLETMSQNPFGHDHFSDRAQSLLWHHSAANKLPDHVRTIDVGAFTSDNQIVSLGKAQEFFIVTHFVEGQEYSNDLARIFSSERLEPLDESRAVALARYLARIHRTRLDAPHLYSRRIRDLLGHGECIMGLIDNYPVGDPVATPARLQKIEELCLEWRWRIKSKHHRLCQVHGDFHPWNVLFHEGTRFTVLDRSRGEWGEPADDVGSMTMNFLFFSLQKHGCLKGSFEKLCDEFWSAYLQETGDIEMFGVIQPFFAWRGLVLANPVWYPRLSLTLRESIFRFIERILTLENFLPDEVNQYLEKG